MHSLSKIPLNCHIPELLYKNNSTATVKENIILFKEHDILILDTYYASFSIGKWKKLTNLQTLFLTIEFKGEIEVNIRHIEPGENIKDFKKIYLASKNMIEYSIKLQDFEKLNGILTIEMVAIEESTIRNIYWGTEDTAKREVSLAIIITTFNRHDSVQNSINKILNGLSKELKYHLYVIDNGSNLDLKKHENLTLIHNKNYGGAGGFSRGLDEAINNKYSHCLFMDDDANCLTESIERAYRLIQYSINPKLAIGGSMLYSEYPTIQHESGAQFYGYCRPLKHKLDLTDLGSLIENERYEKIDYAGWWFFMFPTYLVKQYAYPFFVRGDDSNFCIQHDFDIQTLNGIGSWQESFSYKSSPLTEYLDMRYHLAHKFHIDYLDDDMLDILRTFWKFVSRNNNKYLYESAEACCLAFEDFLAGPEYFDKDLDASQVREKIGKLREKEVLELLLMEVRRDFDYHYLGKFWKYARKFTFNGHLLPSFLLDESLRFVNKSHPPERAFFLAKNVTFVHPETNKGFTIHHSKKRFFKNLAKATKLSIEYSFKHKQIKKKYQDSYEKMCSTEQWRERFKKSN